MSLKKVALILLAIIILGGGLFVVQKNKQKKELAEHHKKQFQQILTFAKKSDSAGLLEMVSSINTYQKSKGQYPENLMQLFPEFIPEKDFITTLNWKYEIGNGTFLIARQPKGRVTFAMGPDMIRISTLNGSDFSIQKIASIKASNKLQKSSRSKNLHKKNSPAPDAKDRLKILTFNSPKLLPTPVKQTASENLLKKQQEFSIVEKELTSNEKFLLSINTNNLYVWKTRNGIIGFSNIQYPDQKDLVIYKNKTWVEYKYNKNSSKLK